MRTRTTGYKQYGFYDGEAKELKNFCRSKTFKDHMLLWECALEANSDIADDLFYTIVAGVSYDELLKIKYIPLSKGNFYGYQRKCLALLRDRLLEQGLWKTCYLSSG